MRRVAVTGMGMVTPIGSGKEEFWQGLLKGRSGIRKVTAFDAGSYPCQIAGEVPDFDPARYMEKREAKKMDRFTQFGAAAALMAWRDAGLDRDEIDRDAAGVFVGSGIGGIRTIEEQYSLLLEKGPRRVSPFLVPALIANMAAGYISILLLLRGPNSTAATACASSNHAVGDAYRVIQRGEAEIMVAGGAEAAISEIAFAGFCSARALSTRNDEPAQASRPFDRKRDGFVMGEGAGIVILESLDHALKRGAHIYAELAGYGMSADAYHITAPDPEGAGAVLSMQRALESAGLAPEAVDYINAHGTSTEYNDRIETLAIKKTFGRHASSLAVSSTKSMTGHLLGAAGAVELIATLLCIEHQTVHPTINYEFPDPDCDLDYVPNRARAMKIDVALNNSFGFGGTNATLVVKRYVGE
ncbi:MAG TPA: beta-ketoacyl-ACP synthase II [Bacillota bacterium]|nr:beta-ketoacyl-ACP synthase II [Bacillota bacterium]HOJ83654.1 beta-ketoacyl-ACP synthase II [Bacillota bacterium]HOL15465.1 beta-ketoacyl-ACP synthase II [Bacillota bacterium]HPZ11621.1 beta-ketoacyl-ACP synthase II [Bacillota bacterium]